MMVESCLPGDDLDSLGKSSSLNLSSSMSSLYMGSMHSPTDKDTSDKSGSSNGGRMRHSSANQIGSKPRGGSFKQKEKKKHLDALD